MSKQFIPPFMIPTRRREQPAQIPLPAPEYPSIHDRRPPDESDRDPFTVDIGSNDGDQGSERSVTYRF